MSEPRWLTREEREALMVGNTPELSIIVQLFDHASAADLKRAALEDQLARTRELNKAIIAGSQVGNDKLAALERMALPHCCCESCGANVLPEDHTPEGRGHEIQTDHGPDYCGPISDPMAIRVKALERIADLAQPIAWDQPAHQTRKYVEVQIDLETWLDLREALRAAGRGGA